MLRFIGSYSRTTFSSHGIISTNNVLKFIRPISNQHKTVENQTSNEETTTRRSPSKSTHRLNIQKLFSDDDSDITSVKNVRQNNDTSHDDDRQVEERRENSQRRKFVKPSIKQTQTEKKSLNASANDEDFDDSQIISQEKSMDTKFKSQESFNKQLKQTPKQPKREKSLTTKSADSVNSSQSASAPLLAENINKVDSMKDLLEIFDQYIVPTEFAMGLQKMCRLASIENSDAVQIYLTSDNVRQRIESLLINFLGKFSDHEISTVITFATKFYMEDNEFTEKFSLALANRLRRISVHQIVRILEELKSPRHTAQWSHRIYNRLLTLAEGRYFEFDSIRDILSLTHKLSYNDRFISRLDERILEISETITFEDWFKILINKSMLKRRDRTIIRAACYHLLKLSDSFLFPIDKLKDSLLACAMLNVYDKSFLERLTRDAYEQVNRINDQFIIQSIITSMGTLRLRHCELLDAFGKLISEQPESLSLEKTKILQSFIRTCASVNYLPTVLPKLIKDHLNLNDKFDDEQDQLNEIKERIDLVWSLAILDQANQNQVSNVLRQDVFQSIQNEVSNSRIASALKLLTIYSYSLQKFSKRFLKPTFNIEQLAQQLTLKNSNAQDQLAKAVTSFAAENKYSKFSVVTSNMIVIDCLMIVDKNGTPQDLNNILINGENSGSTGQTTFNKVRIDENLYKIAIKCLDYQDKTLLTDSISGPIALHLRLLNLLGYKCVPIHYDEFIKIQVPNDRIKYVQRKIKETINSTPNSEKKTNA